ncbi:MAG: hypothetical protein JWM27_605 [Gemmatimonadetes bacterium]|nr:hypothetical protein [Gemmatimonadota bacterium]
MTMQTSLFTPRPAEPRAPRAGGELPEGSRSAPKPSSEGKHGEAAAEQGTRYWVGVVSAEHVRRGVGGGFAQLCHGKAAPLRRMREGDWLIYYSPAEKMGGGEPVQSFTAIGRVRPGAAYEVEMGGGFVPFRRDVAYRPCNAAPIRPLLPDLAFLPDKSHWGYAFRRGHLQIGRDDFLRIAAAMGVDPASVEEPTSTEPADG